MGIKERWRRFRHHFWRGRKDRSGQSKNSLSPSPLWGDKARTSDL